MKWGGILLISRLDYTRICTVRRQNRSLSKKQGIEGNASKQVPIDKPRKQEYNDIICKYVRM